MMYAFRVIEKITRAAQHYWYMIGLFPHVGLRRLDNAFQMQILNYATN